VAFPSRLLNDGEVVVVSTRTHGKALLLPAVWLILIAAAAGYIASVVPVTRAQWVVQAVVWGLAFLAIAWLVLRPFLRWLTTSYTFTNRRFMLRSGVLAKHGRTIPLNRISGVDYEVGIVDRVFGCGTLVVSDASETGTVLLHDIPQVERVQMQIAEELHRLSYPGTNAADDGT
jgi:membrane protein YdbS with pleckstrin-like domain